MKCPFSTSVEASDQLLKIGDVASRISSSKASVYKLAESGKIPHFKIRGAGLRFDPIEVEKWIAGQKVGRGSK